MASLNLYPQFETNLMSNHNVIELLLQLKGAKAHGKNYIKVKAHLVRHLLRDHLFAESLLLQPESSDSSAVKELTFLEVRDWRKKSEKGSEYLNNLIVQPQAMFMHLTMTRLKQERGNHCVGENVCFPNCWFLGAPKLVCVVCHSCCFCYSATNMARKMSIKTTFDQTSEMIWL